MAVFDLENLRKAEYFSKKIVSAETSQDRDFLTDEGLDVLEGIYDGKGNYVSVRDQDERRVYDELEDELGILREVDDGRYFIAWDNEDIEFFHDRVKQHLKRGYDRPELVGYLRSEYERMGEPPTQTDFREKEGFPSEMPYKSRYGDWNNALLMAGLDTKETGVGKDILEAELLVKTHEMNEDNDFLEKTPSARQINEENRMHSETQFQHHFGSIEEAFESAGLGKVRDMESSEGEKSTSRPYRVRERR